MSEGLGKRLVDLTMSRHETNSNKRVLTKIIHEWTRPIAGLVLFRFDVFFMYVFLSYLYVFHCLKLIL